MKGKLLSSILVCAVAFSMVIPKASAWKLADWSADGGYGSATEVNENVTNIKGANVATNGMYYGPFSKVSTQKLETGINEQINVELKAKDYAYGEYFHLTVALKNKNGDHIREVAVETQKVNDNTFKITAGWAPGFEALISEDGVYTYQYKMFEKEGKYYANFTILKWDEVIKTTGDFDLDDDAFVTEDVKKVLKDHEDVSTRYIWFCNINVANGVNVYTTLPEKPVINPEPSEPGQEVVTTVTTQKPESNPKTADGIGFYFIIALVGLGAVGFTAKSLIKHH